MQVYLEEAAKYRTAFPTQNNHVKKYNKIVARNIKQSKSANEAQSALYTETDCTPKLLDFPYQTIDIPLKDYA
jgi:hypothetical protein